MSELGFSDLYEYLKKSCINAEVAKREEKIKKKLHRYIREKINLPNFLRQFERRIKYMEDKDGVIGLLTECIKTDIWKFNEYMLIVKYGEIYTIISIPLIMVICMDIIEDIPIAVHIYEISKVIRSIISEPPQYIIESEWNSMRGKGLFQWFLYELSKRIEIINIFNFHNKIRIGNNGDILIDAKGIQDLFRLWRTMGGISSNKNNRFSYKKIENYLDVYCISPEGRYYILNK